MNLPTVHFLYPDKHGTFAAVHDVNSAFYLWGQKKWKVGITVSDDRHEIIRVYNPDDWRGREEIENLFGERFQPNKNYGM